MIVANTDHAFLLDNVMFLESYRYTRNILGHIYLQKFPSGKLYAGQTINFYNRIKQYKRNKGNNDHHTNALKKYNFRKQLSLIESNRGVRITSSGRVGGKSTKVIVVYQQCPLYLLNIVETFLIEFYNLTNSTFGYNKTTGGRKGYTVSDETRAKLSLRQIGEKNHMYGRTGENNPMFGKKFKKTPEQKAKTMGENNPMFGKRGELSPNFGRKKTEEELAKMSERMSGENNHMFGKKGELSPIFGENNGMFGIKGINNPTYGDKNGQAKQICVFGKLYGSASAASDILREVCDTIAKGNFIKIWATRRKMYNVFYVTREFYNTMYNKDIQITREMYENWINLTV